MYRHERSQQLLTITNRLGHTPSYKTIVRLHQEAAARSRLVPNTFMCAHRHQAPFSHNFIVKVADNFDINQDRLHSENSIHHLNQIIVSTPENAELPVVVSECLYEIVDMTVKSEVCIAVSICCFSFGASSKL